MNDNDEHHLMMMKNDNDDSLSCCFSYLSSQQLLQASCSICIVVLDASTGKAIETNAAFTKHLGPLYKFQEYPFWDAATTDTSNSGRDLFRKAIQQVMININTNSDDNNNTDKNDIGAEEDTTNSSNTAVDSLCIHAVEMLTLCGEAGLPRKKCFDWTIGCSTNVILLFGTATAAAAAATFLSSSSSDGQEEEQEENAVVSPANKSNFKDTEFVDFFQNAPIALHWLSDNGIVLWANQTELDVLGYTAEEYIGQPIMNFCPDEQELVLEIFKQLGSGNAIRDVPVRFRTKDGRIVNLLIDSNVKYDTVRSNDKTGETVQRFGHTRCFIRDDTGRKIREARAQTLLHETKRSLQMLDNFSSRSIHHMRTPLHIMQNTCELVTEQLLQQLDDDSSNADSRSDKKNKMECISLLRNAEAQIVKAVRLSDDLVQLGRLDQGAELVTNNAVIDLASWGEEVLYASFMSTAADATVTMKDKSRPLSLEITPVIIGGDNNNRRDNDCDGGPAKIYADPSVLHRVLTALLEHARKVNDYNRRDVVTLRIGYQNGGMCTFEVIFKVDTKMCDADDGYCSSASTTSSNQEFSAGKFPAIFQRYHQEYIPEEAMEVDFETASSLREGIERHVNSFKDDNLGISLSLAYFLVQGLGSELRYALQPNGMTKFMFVLPKQDLPDGVDCSKLLPKMVVFPNEESERSTKTRTTTQEISLDHVPTLDDSFQKASFDSKSAVASSIPTAKEPTGPGLIAPLKKSSSTPLFATAPSSSINNNNTRKRNAPFSQQGMSPLKLKKEEPIAIDVPMSKVACQGLKSMDPPHVLIVEDTEMCAKLLRMMLGKFHCTSDTAVNGLLAVEKLRNAALGEYDLVLMDLRMPVMDGLTATKILKQEMNLTVPIIALTAETTVSIRTECEEIGFNDFYSKPLKRDGLKDVLLKHTGYHVV